MHDSPGAKDDGQTDDYRGNDGWRRVKVEKGVQDDACIMCEREQMMNEFASVTLTL